MGFPLAIIPNKGLGHILFGANPDELRHQLGTPSSVEDWKELNAFSIRLTYEDPVCSFFFYDGASWNAAFVGGNKPALVLITAASPHFTLLGKPIVGQREQLIRSRLAAQGLTNPTEVPMEQDL